MKIFLKIFGVAFVCFVLLFGSIFFAFNTFMRERSPNDNLPPIRDTEGADLEEMEPEIKDELLRAAAESRRINFIVLGLEGVRSDTMMFMSFDPEEKGLDIISIPRDTYYPRVGYDGPGKAKINAAYGDHGAVGVKTVVSDLLLDIPVDYYVTITYKGAESIVNAIGGVPVYIPKPMIYRDDYDKPPLIINIPAGQQVLNGENAVKFLRYRKPTPGSGGLDRDGDLGRIQAQQEFIQAALKKAMSLGNLPGLVTNTFRFVRTDMELQNLLRHATSAIGLNMENVTMNVLPGEARYKGGVSYYFYDPVETRGLLLDMYGVSRESTDIQEKEDE
ncbi:LCP family protein [Natronincola ferrireducens]|uniref:Transcriptional attenuator, LytR family n=1 Tax=Natronincola ferrireducens TaxID=393762 RepID=A0A1G8WWN0_9FIRM|nr:LCP family protein [Natronincola ferrireducens]SDJ82792.1 transcriptional attenuator, LytR family [Natronincola ferrireducens]